ncbi:MAG: hypothetical protein PHV43_00785 [Candidatus Colwellbacteria bacterium]|nr:hypothetical protein [Candidatus Colwellbacteria bacterium]
MRITELHPDQAVTIFSAVKIAREHPTRALTPVDLENYISQAVWKFFDRCRGEAAAKLNVREMDLVLSDVRITGVRIDGHQIINPTGFTGSEFEIGLSLTVTRSGVADEGAYLVEGGSMRAYMLAKILGLGRAFFIESGGRTTSIFSINGSEIHHLNSFQWGKNNIIESLNQSILVLEEGVLHGLYDKYAIGNTSEKLCRKIDKVFYQAFDAIVGGALTSVKNAGGMRFNTPPTIYFYPRFSVPSGVYRKYFPSGRMKLRFFKVDEDLDIETFINENIHGVYEELNELAARRIKWLMPAL